MASHEGVHQDYFEVHHRQLDALARAAEAIVLGDPAHVSVTKHYQAYGEGRSAVSRILAGEVTPEAVRSRSEADGKSVDIAEAESTAESLNEKEVVMAEAAFKFLQAIATLHCLERQDTLGLLDVQATPQWLLYDNAERHYASLSPDLTIGITKLHEVEQLGQVTECAMYADDGPIRHRLTIHIIDECIVSAQSDVRPREDRELLSWIKALGSVVNDIDVKLALVGGYEDEAALEATLTGVRRQFEDTITSEGLTSIIDGMRVRARAAHEAAALERIDPTVSLPSADRLDEWIARLGDV